MNNKVFEFINLHNGEEDKKKVLENITSSISFRGSNLWILACAIIVASIGLNVNSTAVIIGAMLISPLMGPIIGAGFALGTYNFGLLKRSFKNLLIATVVSLVVSTVYFFISPFKDVQSELLSRTAPNIYDVLIAFFGGLVGVIAITRVEKGNPIPGVAIATALMPPLCTAGYGLAIGNIHYFLGAFYLYTINCFFICIATFLIIKYLKYPPVKTVNEQYEKKIHYLISAIIVLMLIPSFYLAYNLFNQKKYSQNVEHFIQTEFTTEGQMVIYKKVNFNSNPKKIELAFLAKKFTPVEIAVLKNKLPEYGLLNTELFIRQDNKDIKSEILNEIGNQNKNISEKDIAINQLKRELLKYKFDNLNMIKEVEILFPEMKDISIGKHLTHQNTDSTKIETVLIFSSNKKELQKDISRLKLWLQQKLNTKDIKIIRQE